MKKIFVVLFCFITVSLFSLEDLYLVDPERTTDFRNKVWYYGTNSISNMEEFLYRFHYLFVKEAILDEPGGNFDIIRNSHLFPMWTALLNRGRDHKVPGHIFMVMIVCNDRYGVLVYCWDDQVSFGSAYRATGMRIMSRNFFELKIP